MITIRLNAARSDVTVEEDGAIASRIEINLAKSDHRAGLLDLIETTWKARERGPK